MAIVFTQLETAGDCAPAAYCSGQSANTKATPVSRQATDGGSAGSTEVSIAVDNAPMDGTATTITHSFHCNVAAAATWNSGTWTVRVNLTTLDAGLTFDEIHICRVSSGCANQATIGSATGLGITTTGVKTQNVTGSAQSPSAGDDVQVLLVFTNTNEHGNQNAGVTPNQNIDSPFTQEIIQSVGLITETDTSQAITAVKTKAVGLVREWDDALPVGCPLYDYRIEFSTDDSSPIAATYSGEDGALTTGEEDPGGAGGTLSVANGKLSSTTQTTPAWGELGYYGTTTIARVAGKMIVMKVEPDHLNNNVHFSWSTAASLAVTNHAGVGFSFTNSGILTVRAAGSNVSQFTFAANSRYSVINVLRATGNKLYISEDEGPYRLLWTYASVNTTNLRPWLTINNGTGTIQNDFVWVPQNIWVQQPRIADGFSGTNGTSLDGRESDGASPAEEEGGGGHPATVLAGSAEIDTNQAKLTDATEAIVVYDARRSAVYMQAAIDPTSGTARPSLIARCSDASNFWEFTWDHSLNEVQIWEENGGTRTKRASTAKTPSVAGVAYTLVVRCFGNTLQCVAKETVTDSTRAEWTSAFNNTATQCGLRSTDSGDLFDWFEVWEVEPTVPQFAIAPAVGQASEADSAFAVTAVKTVSVGLASEADSALGMIVPLIVSVGLATETDTALAVSAPISVGLVTETDTAQPITSLKTVGVSFTAFESDGAIDITVVKTVAVGQASEADSALAITIPLVRFVDQVIETDSALSITAGSILAVGLVTETDSAFAITIPTVRFIDQASESDTALAITSLKTVDVGLSSEVETSLAIGDYTLTTGDGFEIVFNSTDASISSIDDTASTKTFTLNSELGGWYIHDLKTAQTNLWSNGDFASSFTNWTGTGTTGVSIQTTGGNKYLRLNRGATDLNVSQANALEAGKTYALYFDYRATTGGTKWCNIIPTGDNWWRINAGVWQSVAQWQPLNLSAANSASTWTAHSFIFNLSSGQDGSFNLQFRVSSGAGTFEVDNVRIEDLDADPTRMSHTITPGVDRVTMASSGNDLSLSATLQQKTNRIDVTASISNTSTSSSERAVDVVFRLPLNPKGYSWGHSFDAVRAYSTSNPQFFNYLGEHVLINAANPDWNQSASPVGLLSDGDIGAAIGQDIDTPRPFKIFADSKGLAIRYHVGLSTVTSSTHTYTFSLYKLDDAGWYLRDAMKKYSGWHTALFTNRDTEHGTSVFNMPTATTGRADFGARYDFRGFSNTNKGALQDDGLRLMGRPMGVEWHLAGTTITMSQKHQLLDNTISGMATTNAFTWTTGNGATYNTRYDTPAPFETFEQGRQRFLNCAYNTSSGEWISHDFSGALALMGVSALPALTTPNMARGERVYKIDPDITYVTSTLGRNYDGIDFDNVALGPGRTRIDYNATNWAAQSSPLSFDPHSKDVVSLTAHQYFELLEQQADDMHARSPVALCLANVSLEEQAQIIFAKTLDQLGGEDRWDAPNHRALIRTRRMLSYQKAINEIHNASTSIQDDIDSVIAKSILYASWPAIWKVNYQSTEFNSTANRATCLTHYPHIRTLDNAGWEWIPYVTSTYSGSDVIIERFGNFNANPPQNDLHFAIHNATTSAKSITLTLNNTALGITSTATNWAEIYPSTDSQSNVTTSLTINVPAERTEVWEVTAAGPITIAVGQASETDTAFGITAVKTVGVGLASETDTAFAVTSNKTVAVAFTAFESDGATAIQPLKTVAISFTAFESDGATAVQPLKTVSVTFTAFESDGATAIAVTKTVPISFTGFESDGATAIQPLKTVSVGLASEADTALSVTLGAQTIAVGLASETDTALAIGKQVSTGQATETDSAQPITARKTVAVAFTGFESDGATAVSIVKTVPLAATAFESDGAVQVGVLKTRILGAVAFESDGAIDITAVKTVSVGLITETQTAQPITLFQKTLVGLATETDTALPVALKGAPQFSTNPLATGRKFAITATGRVLGISTVGRYHA